MGPLSGKTILVTRPAGGDDDLVAALRSRGAEVLIAPAIAFEPPDDPQPAREAIANISRYDWLLVTSVRGVEAFFEFAAEAGPAADTIARTRIAAAGPKTAAAARRLGGHVALMPATFSGEAAAQALLGVSAPGERMLIVRAQEGDDGAAQRLRAAGRNVDIVAGYKTVHLRDPEIARRALAADAIALASGSAAVALGRNIDPRDPRLVSKTIVCIGEATARSARACGFAVDAIAREATAEGLAEAIETLFTGRV